MVKGERGGKMVIALHSYCNRGGEDLGKTNFYLGMEDTGHQGIQDSRIDEPVLVVPRDVRRQINSASC